MSFFLCSRQGEYHEKLKSSPNMEPQDLVLASTRVHTVPEGPCTLYIYICIHIHIDGGGCLAPRGTLDLKQTSWLWVDAS